MLTDHVTRNIICFVRQGSQEPESHLQVEVMAEHNEEAEDHVDCDADEKRLLPAYAVKNEDEIKRTAFWYRHNLVVRCISAVNFDELL